MYLHPTHPTIPSARSMQPDRVCWPLSIIHDEDSCLNCSAAVAHEGLVKLELPAFHRNCQQPQTFAVYPNPRSQGAQG